MTLDPNLIAFADQRQAAAAHLLNQLIRYHRDHVMWFGVEDSIVIQVLAKELDEGLTAAGAMSDVLALAVRRLAAYSEEEQ